MPRAASARVAGAPICGKGQSSVIVVPCRDNTVAATTLQTRGTHRRAVSYRRRGCERGIERLGPPTRPNRAVPPVLRRSGRSRRPLRARCRPRGRYRKMRPAKTTVTSASEWKSAYQPPLASSASANAAASRSASASSASIHSSVQCRGCSSTPASTARPSGRREAHLQPLHRVEGSQRQSHRAASREVLRVDALSDRGFESPRSPQVSRAYSVAGGHGNGPRPTMPTECPARAKPKCAASRFAAPITPIRCGTGQRRRRAKGSTSRPSCVVRGRSSLDRSRRRSVGVRSTVT